MKTYIDPNRNAITLMTNFPIGMLILFAIILPKPQRYSQEDLQDRDSLLSALFYALPVPRNLFQRWIVNRLVEWIYRERGLVCTLLQIGVAEVGYLPR